MDVVKRRENDVGERKECEVDRYEEKRENVG